jgi:hypothetical protein
MLSSPTSLRQNLIQDRGVLQHLSYPATQPMNTLTKMTMKTEGKRNSMVGLALDHIDVQILHPIISARRSKFRPMTQLPLWMFNQIRCHNRPEICMNSRLTSDFCTSPTRRLFLLRRRRIHKPPLYTQRKL